MTETKVIDFAEVERDVDEALANSRENGYGDHITALSDEELAAELYAMAGSCETYEPQEILAAVKNIRSRSWN